jgi:di/tripeptidase
MEINRLKDILSLPSYFGHEGLVRDYIVNFAIDNQLQFNLDTKGNVYVFKGELNEGEFYPCVVAHMDTVYKNQIEMVRLQENLDIIETEDNGDIILRAKNNGIGGDDKCGVAICLELLLQSDKIMAAFFVEEEFGCRGSKLADKVIFEKVGYVIEFDAPSDNWCSEYCYGIKLYTEDVFNKIKPILTEHKITNISNDPYTDVVSLKKAFDFICLNFFAGYYNQHSGPREFVSFNDVNKAITMGHEIIELLGNEKYVL